MSRQINSLFKAVRIARLVMGMSICGVLALQLQLQLHAQDTKPAPDSKQPSVESESTGVETNSVPHVPQSVFAIPTSSQEGRDPFFPGLNERTTPVLPANKGAKPAPGSSANDLVLQGISGTPDRRLCVVNGRTMAAGDDLDIPVGGSAIKVRCLEINETFVVIELGGERRELYFKTAK